MDRLGCAFCISDTDVDGDDGYALPHEFQRRVTTDAAASAHGDNKLITERFALAMLTRMLQCLEFRLALGMFDQVASHFHHACGVCDRQPVPYHYFAAPVLRHPVRKVF